MIRRLLCVAAVVAGVLVPASAAFAYDPTSLWPFGISTTSVDASSSIETTSDPIGAGFEAPVKQYAYLVSPAGLGSFGGSGVWSGNVTPPPGVEWVGWCVLERRAAVSCSEGYTYGSAYQTSSGGFFCDQYAGLVKLAPVNTWAQNFVYGNIAGRSWGECVHVIVRVGVLYHCDETGLHYRVQAGYEGAAECSMDYSWESTPTPASLAWNTGSLQVRLWSQNGSLTAIPDEQQVLSFYGGGVTDDPVAIAAVTATMDSTAGVSSWATSGVPADPDGIPDTEAPPGFDTPGLSDFKAWFDEQLAAFSAPIRDLLWWLDIFDPAEW